MPVRHAGSSAVIHGRHPGAPLTGGAPAAFFRLNQRILNLWEGCWRMALEDSADPRVDIETVELASAGGGTVSLARAAQWLAPAAR